MLLCYLYFIRIKAQLLYARSTQYDAVLKPLFYFHGLLRVSFMG